ncbi:hypothetical protein [Reichenbachiella versicolor]|uniref:hypothetical protein n=1 Tax=Reichenbachiella versicolor TaxID=1821036 RepID=UPI000D6E6EA8|nr:hypothetical protein [Reichenbachiella versicolor]
MGKSIVFTQSEKAMINKAIGLRLDYDADWKPRFEGVAGELKYPETLLKRNQRAAIIGCINEFDELLTSIGHSNSEINQLLKKLK